VGKQTQAYAAIWALTAQRTIVTTHTANTTMCFTPIFPNFTSGRGGKSFNSTEEKEVEKREREGGREAMAKGETRAELKGLGGQQDALGR